MEALYTLKDKLWDELEKIGKKPDMSAGDLELTWKVTDTIKNINKICMLEEDDGGHSQDGNWQADIRGNYGHGNSYANRGKHYVRGHYSRNNRGMGGYSGHGDRDDLERVMERAGVDRETIRRCMESL